MQSCTVHNKEHRQDIISQHLIAVVTLFFFLLSFFFLVERTRFVIVKCVYDEILCIHLSWAPSYTFYPWICTFFYFFYPSQPFSKGRRAAKTTAKWQLSVWCWLQVRNPPCVVLTMRDHLQSFKWIRLPSLCNEESTLIPLPTWERPWRPDIGHTMGLCNGKNCSGWANPQKQKTG